jgi:hypothetical protein
MSEGGERRTLVVLMMYYLGTLDFINIYTMSVPKLQTMDKSIHTLPIYPIYFI